MLILFLDADTMEVGCVAYVSATGCLHF